MNLLFAPTSKTCCGVVSVDWLAFSVTLFETSEERDAHSWLFRSLPVNLRCVEFPGTSTYKRRLIIFFEDGRKLLTLLCEPYSRVIPRDSALVEVANEFLYKGFAQVMDLLYSWHPCAFRCLSRLDVCCDFPLTSKRAALVRQLSLNSAYVQGKRDGVSFHSFVYEDAGVERSTRQLSWGSKNSNIKWKLYNKSLEVFEFDNEGHRVCHKPYIVEQWASQGWDVMNVWRLEVSVCPMAKFEFYGRRLGWSDVINGFTMEDLFVSLYQTRFVIRLNQGHRDKSNDRRVHLLADFGLTERLRQWINPAPQSLEVVEYASCLRSAMVQLEKPEVQVNPQMRELWYHTASECVRLGHLEGYFLNLYGCTFDNYEFTTCCSLHPINLPEGK